MPNSPETEAWRNQSSLNNNKAALKSNWGNNPPSNATSSTLSSKLETSRNPYSREPIWKQCASTILIEMKTVWATDLPLSLPLKTTKSYMMTSLLGVCSLRTLPDLTSTPPNPVSSNKARMEVPLRSLTRLTSMGFSFRKKGSCTLEALVRDLLLREKRNSSAFLIWPINLCQRLSMVALDSREANYNQH